MNSRRRGARGFTLVELMVSILIVAVLAALSFIGYQKVKASSSAAVDANDLRSVFGAIQMYCGDNNGILPTTSGGVGPIWTNRGRGLVKPLAPYLGGEDPYEGQFFPELAAARWQKRGVNEDGPSLLVMHRVYSGRGKCDNPSRPQPNFLPFGYPYGDARRDGMKLSAAMSKMGNPAQRLMLTEVDREHPNFVGSTPGWFDGLPSGMAHGSYRLGLYWDGHVGRLNQDLTAK
ncbi:type II secretion system protein [Haloferula rosea]|uniref:Type II secretion system protein n=1 Tax=Haloferula rosea TaxID=490093 RepID=A0A934VG17_9BACT|nr:type II secretion system protein [Haloferula rosea]MBK1827626.1 type II secretion system protein [Haloferula rosea]